MIKSAIKKTSLYKYYLDKKHQAIEEKERNDRRIVRGPLIDKYLPKNGIGAEVGVFKGAYSRVLFEVSKAKEFHLIDLWYFLDSHWNWANGNKSTVDALCKILKENKDDIDKKKILIHVRDDIKVMQDFTDHYFDWVYIDSRHEYEHVRNELEVLKDKVKPSGVICGDDWRPDPKHHHHGVYVAICEFMTKYDYELLYANDVNLQWFIRKK